MKIKVKIERQFDVFHLLRRDDERVDLSNIDEYSLEKALNEAIIDRPKNLEFSWRDGLSRFSLRWDDDDNDYGTNHKYIKALDAVDSMKVQVIFKYETVEEIKEILPEFVANELEKLNRVLLILK